MAVSQFRRGQWDGIGVERIRLVGWIRIGAEGRGIEPVTRVVRRLSAQEMEITRRIIIICAAGIRGEADPVVGSRFAFIDHIEIEGQDGVGGDVVIEWIVDGRRTLEMNGMAVVFHHDGARRKGRGWFGWWGRSRRGRFANLGQRSRVGFFTRSLSPNRELGGSESYRPGVG